MNEAGICSGCGVCAGICPARCIDMVWNACGELRAVKAGCCRHCGLCRRVCPFENDMEGDETLKRKLFPQAPVAFKGYDPALRECSASGGLATRFLQGLLSDGIVDFVICAGRRGSSLGFQIVADPKMLPSLTGSVYFPMELSETIKTVMRQEGRYAVIGLPCVIKALRKAAAIIPSLDGKLIVFAGLICGRQMNARFPEYLAMSAGLGAVPEGDIRYHAHDGVAPASDYSADITRPDGNIVSIRCSDARYETGWAYFGLEACRYCDDVFADYADASFMDAWLPEYAGETHGTSLVLLRNPAYVKCFSGCPTIKPALMDEIIAAQTGSRVLPDKTERVVLRALFSGKLKKLPLKNKRISPLRLLLEGLPVSMEAATRRFVSRSFSAVRDGRRSFHRFYGEMRFLHYLRRLLSAPYAVLYFIKHRGDRVK